MFLIHYTAYMYATLVAENRKDLITYIQFYIHKRVSVQIMQCAYIKEHLNVIYNSRVLAVRN